MNAEMERMIDSIGDCWMARTSKNGIGYGGFKWEEPGVWTEAPDWDESPTCKSGLFGQGPGGFGFAKSGNRFEFCQTGIERVTVDNNKVKAKRARILWTGAEAFAALVYASKQNFPGSLYLRGCDLKGIALPQSVGGSLDI